VGVSVADGFTNMTTALTSGIEAAEADVANGIAESKMSVLGTLDKSKDAVVDRANRSATDASTVVAQQLDSCKEAILENISSVATAAETATTQAVAKLNIHHETMLDSVTKACDAVTHELSAKMGAVRGSAGAGRVASIVATIESGSGSGGTTLPPPATATPRKRLRLTQDDSSLESTRFNKAVDELLSELRRYKVQDGTVSSCTALHQMADAILKSDFAEHFDEFYRSAPADNWYCCEGVMLYGYKDNEVGTSECFCGAGKKYCVLVRMINGRVQFGKGPELSVDSEGKEDE
jgi:hypothetical protein